MDAVWVYADTQLCRHMHASVYFRPVKGQTVSVKTNTPAANRPLVPLENSLLLCMKSTMEGDATK